MSNDYQMKLCVHVVLLYLSVNKSAKIRIISIFIWIIFINHNLQDECIYMAYHKSAKEARWREV